MTQDTRSSAAPEMPAPLRRDVRLLGELLGRVLAESGDEGLLDDVEALRSLTIEAYGGSEDALAQAEEFVAGLSDKRAADMARAFTCYFHLVNLAEEYHRARTLRARDFSDPQGILPAVDTIPGAISQLKGEVGEEETMRRLAALEFRPVLTAHPTEARRRAVSSAIRRISASVAALDDPRANEAEVRELHRQILADIDVMWRTALVRTEKPTVLDEVRTAMSVFDTTLFEQIPLMYRALDTALQPETTGTVPPKAPAFVRMGTWIGGDRDGNPNVTAKITREASIIAAEHILLGLEKHTTRVGRELTLDAATTPPSRAVLDLLERHRDLSEELATAIEERSPGEPYRQVLLFMAGRIKATRERNADLAYHGPEEFLEGLRLVQSSLAEAGDGRSAYGELQHLIWQVETFGFHLAELEVRQHSQVHAETLAELREKGVDGDLSPRSKEVLDTFRMIGRIQRRYGPSAARRYIVSFTQKAQDLAAVFELAEISAHGGTPPVIDSIPLFETFEDLNNSVDILDEAIKHPTFAERLAARDRKIEVMLGYSDSSKDVGPVSATLALYDAQQRIAQWALDNDLELTLFHGRGGALGRGGGPANRAVLAQPPHSVDGRFKLTEQGEVIFARYGDKAIASRHIDQVGAATLMSSAPSIEARNSGAAEKFADIAATMDRVSRERFYQLVRSEGFPQWFAQVTPLEEVGLLALGSRPAKRGLSVNSLDDLRAIPWVFSWTQARINLTGWFGLGTALAAVGDVATLRSAYEEWPLLATLLDNVEMSLSKADERIARRYLALGDREDLADLVMEEMALTREWVLKATGHERPLETSKVLGRAVQLRSPYVDALSLIQLRALRGLRAGAPEEEVAGLRSLLLLSVNGVAAGLQNTG
ncbi:phosphoenolpyruvate carboxylase [Serinibacter salmoneus]|uniref:Phosphoenolpyruvate carboxylase n=1 Tax=Serinibacter salmoneus TaxID=556530 RepID=A0A2A9D000_9MICO|nr:phosphoenolpyruvate carboxylase [Serinibacter salmoneus]PFG19994.1 phosphoenolpyruvate carboxylase type 1 [Serinibacter salmoneus]